MWEKAAKDFACLPEAPLGTNDVEGLYHPTCRPLLPTNGDKWGLTHILNPHFLSQTGLERSLRNEFLCVCVLLGDWEGRWRWGGRNMKRNSPPPISNKRGTKNLVLVYFYYENYPPWFHENRL